MFIVRKTGTREYKNSDVCTATEYPLADKDINGAVIVLNGRYPDEGYVVNEICKEIAYVVEGSGRLVMPDKEETLQAGDLVLLLPGERYCFSGEMKLFTACQPAWHPEQHKYVS